MTHPRVICLRPPHSLPLLSPLPHLTSAADDSTDTLYIGIQSLTGCLTLNTTTNELANEQCSPVSVPEQQFSLTIAAPDTSTGFVCYHWTTTDTYAIDTLGQPQPQVWIN